MKVARLVRSSLVVSFTCVLGFGLIDCADQPRPVCLASPIGFAGKLIETAREASVPGACDEFGPASFNADPEIGLSPFYQPDKDGNPNFDQGSVGIRTAEVGTLYGTATDAGFMNTASNGSVYSLGPFTSGRPDDNGFCHVPTLSPTHVVLPEVPPTPDDPSTKEDESAPGQPAQDITLEWSNLEVYVTAADYGTQFAADLRDTRVTPSGDTCTITYRVLGLAPAVSCAATDADGNPVSNDDGTPMLDPTLCDPQADPAAGRALGSGLTTDADYECDPVTAWCLVRGTSIPATK